MPTRYTCQMKKYIVLGIVLAALVGGGVWIGINTGYVALPQAPVRQPSLDHEAAFARGVSKETEDMLRSKVTLDQDALKKDSTNLDAWLDLAIQYKQGGDISAAVQIWKYLDTAFPQQSTSAFNLGVVYHQNLKQYDRSEKSYQEAIRRDPNAPIGYLGLHELYRYSYKQNTTAAVDVLLEGMKRIPMDANIPIALAAYYRDEKKDNIQAVEYIQKAIAVLKETGGDAQKIKALEGEAVRLNK